MIRHILVWLFAAGAASPAAALLFAKDSGGLSAAEQQQIVSALDVAPGPGGKQLVDTVCNQPVSSEVAFSDWNGDGKREVRIVYGNTCLGGQAGSVAVIFLKDASGKYVAHPFGPGVLPDPKAEKSQGYPDLLVGGPGFCHPVYRWNGKTYVHARNEAESPDGCAGMPVPK